jgi:hypothetical protein
MPTFRNRALMAVLAMAAIGAVAPTVAEAHRVAAGAAQCALVDNVPTITASATFEGFQDSEKPIDGELALDGTTLETVSGFTFAGPDGSWHSAPHTTTPGQHHVSGSFRWPNQNGADGGFAADVTCPAPESPPSPSPSPSPSPAPSSPSPAPPAAAPVGGGAAGSVCERAKSGRYRITVTPRHAKHGLVRFRLYGPRVSHVRWYIDTRPAGRSGKRWEFVRRGGREYGVYLWARERWGEHLWGRHTIEARFRVEDSCGDARTARAQRLYFNRDPRPDDPIFA